MGFLEFAIHKLAQDIELSNSLVHGSANDRYKELPEKGVCILDGLLNVELRWASQ